MRTFLIAYLVGDSWLVELEHQSILRNMPVHFLGKMAAHVKANFQLSIGLFLVLPVVGLILLGIVIGFGDWNYPTAFTLINKITTVPSWLAGLLIAVYAVVLTVLMSVVAIWLNRLIGNFYATLLALITVIIIVTFSPSLPAVFYLTPLPYLSIANVYSGHFLINDHLPIGWVTGLGMMLIWLTGILFVISRWGRAKNES